MTLSAGVTLHRWLSMIAWVILLCLLPGAAECRADHPGPEKELLVRVKVGYVLDGDSIVVKKGSQELQLRLWGVDAPEHDQPHGKEATRFLRRLVDRSELLLIPMDLDKYGRLVAIAYRDRLLINAELIRHGHAWVHRFYCRTEPCEDWLLLEEQARGRRTGLWENQAPVAPWIWKHR